MPTPTPTRRPPGGGRQRAPQRPPVDDWRRLWDERDAWLWLRPPKGARSSAGWALLPLRAFLGATFAFAGLQKLSNPGFFTASNPASIQAQLRGAARLSPIHGLVAHLTGMAVPLGVVIALAELAIGLGTLLGLWARLAAAGGALLSFSLFLTISFHANPYYTGSDIVFVFAWLPLVVAGAGGVLSLDGAIANAARHRHGVVPEQFAPIEFSKVRRVCGSFDHGACSALGGQTCAPGPCPFLRRDAAKIRRADIAVIGRREFTAKGAAAAAVAAAGVVSAGLAAGIGRAVGAAKPAAGSASTFAPISGTTAPAPAGSPTTASSPTRPSHPPGTAIGPASGVSVGGAATFSAPGSGDPSIVLRPSSGSFLAFDAICPHAGCTVQYDPSQPALVCPCHNSVFNAQTGAVEAGPAPTGLQPLPIAEGSDGQLYVQ